MDFRKTYKEGNFIISKSVTDTDHISAGGGRVRKTVTLEMDKPEALYQLKWIDAGIKEAKEEHRRAIYNMTPEGRKNLVFLEKQKAEQAKKRLDELESLKTEYGQLIGVLADVKPEKIECAKCDQLIDEDKIDNHVCVVKE